MTRLVPRGLRERMEGLEARYALVVRAAAFFGLDQPQDVRARTGAWLVRWHEHIQRRKVYVLERWFEGELPIDEALRLLDAELMRGAPGWGSIVVTRPYD